MSIYRLAAISAISRAEFNKIESYAIHYDWNLAFSGKSRGNEHLARTVRLVRKLWEEVHAGEKPMEDDRSKEELDVAVAAALLHDIGLVHGNKGHCFAGRKIAERILDHIGIKRSLTERILHCIMAHDGEIPAVSNEAKLVHDADTIDKLGPLGAIRHIWKISLLGDKRYSWKEYREFIPEHLGWRYDKLYFDESKRYADRLDDARAKMFSDTATFEQLVDIVVNSAENGIPVDELLHVLLEKLPLDDDIKKTIKEQIAV